MPVTYRTTKHKDGSVTQTRTIRRKTIFGTTKVNTETRLVKGPTVKKKKKSLFGFK